jgi:uncharacterized membrane protein YhdT
MAERAGQTDGAVRVIRHRPERGHAMLLPLACGCSCCCCCCLHTAGGLVGAAVATATATGPSGAPATLARTRGAASYWLSFVGTLVAWIAVAFLYGVLDGHVASGVWVALGGILLGLPFLQIAASVVAAISCFRERDPAERDLALRSVLRIAGGSVAGAVAGTCLMGFIALVFVVGSK